MTHLIDKAALLAEIKKKTRGERGYSSEDAEAGYKDCAREIISFLNTLEVKEADLEIEKRMKECPYRQVGCTMYEGHILECKGTCSWVADYPKLEKYKTKKGK